MIRLVIETGGGSKSLALSDCLDPAAEERAHEQAYAWIKALRHARIGTDSFRSAFQIRGDSLWWFAELYLHKTRAILEAHRTIAALERLFERERPRRIGTTDPRLGPIVESVAARYGIGYRGPRPPADAARLARIDAASIALTFAAYASRLRVRRPPAAAARVAAFVHRAFWRADRQDGSAEAYIGAVLSEIEARGPAGSVRYIALGPARNFRARRWWDPLLRRPPDHLIPVEAYAPAGRLRDSAALWHRRHEMRRRLWTSADIRSHAVIQGHDCWSIVREQLAGIAHLQFPWSARAMDEAGAALDALTPSVALTYAEAGGWGRALALECRRRGIPFAGLQHGFIYRHWLNYRHEPDEMAADPAHPADRGFPRPTLTLVYDEPAAAHLRDAGHFPREAVRVTGSAKREELADAIRALGAGDIARARADAGASADRPLVLFAAKHREAAGVLPDLVNAMRGLPDVQLAIKPHPAETPAAYAAAVAGVSNVRVLPVDAPLPALIAAARAIVTVNSTVAIDALHAGVPSLVIGLPNNLSPFVERGVMAGATGADEIRPVLERLLYDQEFRNGVLERADRAIAGHQDGHEARAAVRAADAVLALTGRTD